MSNNQITRHAKAAALDALLENYLGSESVSYSLDTFTGSYGNPLQTFRLLSIDPETEMSVSESALAKITGLPASAFTDETLSGFSQDQLLTALGKCALVWLDCVRAQIHQEITEAQGANRAENPSEDVLSAWDDVRGMASQFEH